jgi:hypothetical protein
VTRNSEVFSGKPESMPQHGRLSDDVSPQQSFMPAIFTGIGPEWFLPWAAHFPLHPAGHSASPKNGAETALIRAMIVKRLTFLSILLI